MGLKIIGQPKVPAWFARGGQPSPAKNASAKSPHAPPCEGADAKQVWKPKKPKLAVIEAKKAMRLLMAEGMAVAGIQVAPDGGFFVKAINPATAAMGGENPWDEALSNGEA